MKIVHVCLVGGYTEGYSYQENYLTKYHALAGHDVTVITTQYCWHKGVWGYCKESDYDNQYGVHIIRIPYKMILPYKVNVYIGLFNGLDKHLYCIKPDIIFVHNIQFQAIRKIAIYKKNNPGIHIYVDSHSDFSVSARNWISKNLLYKIYWKKCAKAIEPYAEKFYGVMPSRVDFLKNIFGLLPARCELLVMGGDDEKIDEVNKSGKGQRIREKYDIAQNDFLIITGGKIDRFKTQTLLLMEAVGKIDNPKVKLIVFGSVEQDLKDQLLPLCITGKVMYIGWIVSDESYEYFAASDLVVFPGRHSVFWEQVVAQGIPMVCKYWEGTNHIDIGGNVIFLKEDSVKEMKTMIEELSEDATKYHKLQKAALSDKRNLFRYSIIADTAIESAFGKD